MTYEYTILFQYYKTRFVHVMVDYILHIIFCFEDMSHWIREDVLFYYENH